MSPLPSSSTSGATEANHHVNGIAQRFHARALTAHAAIAIVALAMVVMFGVSILDVEAHRRVEALLGQEHILGTRDPREGAESRTGLWRGTHAQRQRRARARLLDRSPLLRERRATSLRAPDRLSHTRFCCAWLMLQHLIIICASLCIVGR